MIRSADPSRRVDVPTAVLLGSFVLGTTDHLHELIRAARGGTPAAMRKITEAIRRTSGGVWPEITDAVVVPVPRHVPGPAHRLVMATCAEVGRTRRWPVATDALLRTRSASEGKAGGARDPEAEANTLTWIASTPGSVIVLVDDVLRSGATIQACAMAVRASGDQRTLLALALARAETP